MSRGTVQERRKRQAECAEKHKVAVKRMRVHRLTAKAARQDRKPDTSYRRARPLTNRVLHFEPRKLGTLRGGKQSRRRYRMGRWKPTTIKPDVVINSALEKLRRRGLFRRKKAA